jgi:hypothetical protein
MKTLWIPETSKYDGSQLQCQFAYLNHGVLGDSIVSWRGACDVSFENMADGEDLLAGSVIRGDEMLHFIAEIFEARLHYGVALQRILASLAKDKLQEMNPKILLKREGDDLYWEGKKLSISVAAQSPLSVVIHFAVNVQNSGTPVPTCALTDFSIDPERFAKSVMEAFALEYKSLIEATQKVKPL